MLGLSLGSSYVKGIDTFGSYQSLDLDGNSDYVSLPSGFRTAFSKTTGTFSFWVNIIENEGDTTQFTFKVNTSSGDDAVSFYYHKFFTEWRTSLRSATTTITASYDIPGSGNDDGSGYDDGWQHFACTWLVDGSSSYIKLYRNGSLQDTATGTLGVWDETPDLVYIGNNVGSGAFVDGQIDQFAYWDTALSNDNIAAVYNSGTPMDLTTFQGANYTSTEVSKLQGYWQFEGNALDSSKNGYHGTLVGTAGFSTNQP